MTTSIVYGHRKHGFIIAKFIIVSKKGDFSTFSLKHKKLHLQLNEYTKKNVFIPICTIIYTPICVLICMVTIFIFHMIHCNELKSDASKPHRRELNCIKFMNSLCDHKAQFFFFIYYQSSLQVNKKKHFEFDINSIMSNFRNSRIWSIFCEINCTILTLI